MKLAELNRVSVPETVRKKGQSLGLAVYVSTRKDKKYMVFDGHRMVHFGQRGYADYTFHKDKDRRQRFLTRNHKWKNAPKYSAAWLSYYLLW